MTNIVASTSPVNTSDNYSCSSCSDCLNTLIEKIKALFQWVMDFICPTSQTEQPPALPKISPQTAPEQPLTPPSAPPPAPPPAPPAPLNYDLTPEAFAKEAPNQIPVKLAWDLKPEYLPHLPLDKLTPAQIETLFGEHSKNVSAEDLDILDLSKQIEVLKSMAAQPMNFKLGPKNFKNVQPYIKDKDFIWVSREQINHIDYSKMTEAQFKIYKNIFCGQIYKKNLSPDNFMILVKKGWVLDHEWLYMDQNLITGLDCKELSKDQMTDVFFNSAYRGRFSGEQLVDMIEELNKDDKLRYKLCINILMTTDEQKQYAPLMDLYNQAKEMVNKDD